MKAQKDSVWPPQVHGNNQLSREAYAEDLAQDEQV